MSKYFDILAYLMGKAAGGGGDVTVESKSISSNGTYTAPAGKAYSPVTVDVPNSYAAGDEGKVVSNGQLVAQTAHAEVTANGTIDTTLNNSVVVNVQGGGGYGYTKLAEADFTVNTSSTTAWDVGTISCGSAAWTSDKMIYVRVRDKAGKRNGYFLGSDSFFVINTATMSSPCKNGCRCVIRADGGTRTYGFANETIVGVCAQRITSDGDVIIAAAYSSAYSKTIDGIFHVEVYILDWPDGVSPFAAT